MIENQNNFASVSLPRLKAVAICAPTPISAGVTVAALLSARGIAALLTQDAGDTQPRQGNPST
jgi:hypothetical protein